ncbi:phosphomannomutase CpsG [Citrobacter amalonaticus]|uniref:Phosphomannomutase n=1 Tax=Citrobacter amalonaticus TaxID=35703 RepID=A0A2S4RT22_CITAM|nr:phosphomannomutase CpsG [Citrobacter amalonaticus]POT56921.1 phosphomannomutase CpsG [Citrobacter amalonaticus]POT71835.1 phosphomannomutase CpsG [Citrobacter amalonaticus]POU62975.1 phosphomannomutase CpsG [Citrobacter amalonaticus]POV04811.1 phosphomannomutase CpsG [Citrobacter amalonaticus]
MDELTCFKAYDIRGEVGVNLTPDIAFRIGRAYAAWRHPRRVVVGADIRLSSESLKSAVTDGLISSGVDVIDIGLSGTEEIYFATRELRADGGIQITASHNPAQYNGMKLVREEARPISNDNGLLEIKALAEQNRFAPIVRHGSLIPYDNRPAWIACLLRFLSRPPRRTLRVVVNAGHGTAGPALDALDGALQSHGMDIEFIRLHHQPDGHFPAGVPNPMLEENRRVTQRAVIAHQADFGVAWDGDFDRCFFFDERGEFIESYYLVALFARHFLQQMPGSTVILDPRLTWNTLETVSNGGGKAIISKTGHAFIKARMREEDAVYGGEMSGHHYFRDFGYCDSGMIPLVLMLQIIGSDSRPLSAYIEHAQERFPVSGEINLTVADPQSIMQSIAAHYLQAGGLRDDCDGLSIDFVGWRFNLRASNTEPLLRLNVETRADTALLARKTDELLTLITAWDSDKERL